MTETDAKPSVVVGVDGSQSSKDALAWAAKYAEATGSQVRAITTFESEYFLGGASPNADIAKQAHDNAQAAVHAVLGPNPAVPVKIEVVGGHPAQVLVEASRTADMLVVGSRGHGAFVGMFLGSVSTHCVHHAKCPVLVLHDRE